MGFLATVNMPGYLPMDDDPPVFETAAEAWAWLADQRERDEDSAADDDTGEYSETLGSLRYAAGTEVQYGNPHEDWPMSPDGTGVIYGATPGYDGTHDLGLAYHVSWVDAEPDDE
jgi:hypothetical protein